VTLFIFVPDGEHVGGVIGVRAATYDAAVVLLTERVDGYYSWVLAYQVADVGEPGVLFFSFNDG